MQVSSCSLFHVVVENDAISTTIIQRLNSLKGGRVTFVPLNKVKSTPVSYPKEVVPLLNKLNFSPTVKPAFQQVSIFLLLNQLLNTLPSFHSG